MCPTCTHTLEGSRFNTAWLMSSVWGHTNSQQLHRRLREGGDVDTVDGPLMAPLVPMNIISIEYNV